MVAASDHLVRVIFSNLPCDTHWVAWDTKVHSRQGIVWYTVLVLLYFYIRHQTNYIWWGVACRSPYLREHLNRYPPQGEWASSIDEDMLVLRAFR